MQVFQVTDSEIRRVSNCDNFYDYIKYDCSFVNEDDAVNHMYKIFNKYTANRVGRSYTEYGSDGIHGISWNNYNELFMHRLRIVFYMKGGSKDIYDTSKRMYQVQYIQY